jgi:AcrR family transcriptional regulator
MPESEPVVELTSATQKRFPAKTRGLALQTALQLFNQRGFAAVTTASIAESAGVLEGTLWYHFNSKKDLLIAHVGLLREAFAEANAQAHEAKAETVVRGVFDAYDVIWDFRYLLRDDFRHALPGELDLLQAIQSLNDELDAWAEERVAHAAAHGLLVLPEEEANGIAEIILLIGRYWLDFSEGKYPETDHAALRKRGLRHIFTVLRPYLSQETAKAVRRMLS